MAVGVNSALTPRRMWPRRKGCTVQAAFSQSQRGLKVEPAEEEDLREYVSAPLWSARKRGRPAAGLLDPGQHR